jgi:gag-polypeptide of LTR copia-type
MADDILKTGGGKDQDHNIDMTLLQALKELLTTQKAMAMPIEVPVNSITIKFDGTNYGLWLSMMETHLAGKGKLGYIHGEKPAPRVGDVRYEQWMMHDSMVKYLILNSLDSSLIGNFYRYSTTKEIWDALATTFFDGCDSSHIYDLKHRVHQLKQSGGSLKKYYNELQGLWKEIDFRRPNPMVCTMDIEKHNSWVQEDRVYKFLAELDDRLDSTRADIIQTMPLPTVEQAYARVRREEIRQKVMCDNDSTCNLVVMAMKHPDRAQKHTDRAPEISLSEI